MASLFVRFAPSIESSAALGLDSIEELFGDLGALGRGAHVECVLDSPELEILRMPLPGTPERAGGPLTGKPCGAGTGWLRLKRWRAAPVGKAITARFSAPRSLSFAEREWNLLCRLREHGVGTPEPLAVAREGQGPFVLRSLLLLREPEDLEPLPDALVRARGAERRRLADALGLFLARLFRSGVELVSLDPARLLVARARDPEARVHLGAGAPALAFSGLPEIVLAEVTEGRLRAEVDEERRRAVLAGLARRLPGASVRERIALARHALLDLAPERRRTILHRGCGSVG